MSAALDIAEVLDFAVHMEQKGYEFYTMSAKKFNQLKMMQLFHLLAEQELKHEHIFKAMKENVGPPAGDKAAEAQMTDYLKGFVFGERKSLKEKVNTLKTIEEIIDLAFGIEKDSVVFYAILKKYVGKEHEPAIENILQEEVNHVLMLQKYKTQEIPAPPDVDAL
jgi:rubrerythrin